jgi:hypothetical protein
LDFVEWGFLRGHHVVSAKRLNKSGKGSSRYQLPARGINLSTREVARNSCIASERFSLAELRMLIFMTRLGIKVDLEVR